MAHTPTFEGYGPFLESLKDRIRTARVRAALSVNGGKLRRRQTLDARARLRAPVWGKRRGGPPTCSGEGDAVVSKGAVAPPRRGSPKTG